MTATARHAYPYPQDGDPVAQTADVIQALAERVEAVAPALYHTTIVITAGTSFASKTVNFPSAYPAAPSVLVQVSTKGAATAGYYAQAYDVTAGSFTLRVDKAIGAAPGSNTTVGVAISVAPTKGNL